MSGEEYGMWEAAFLEEQRQADAAARPVPGMSDETQEQRFRRLMGG